MSVTWQESCEVLQQAALTNQLAGNPGRVAACILQKLEMVCYCLLSESLACWRRVNLGHSFLESTTLVAEHL